MANYSTRINTDIPLQEWSDFVYNHHQGNIFQTPEMYSVYMGASHNNPIAVAAFSEGVMKGVLLAVIITNGGVLT